MACQPVWYFWYERRQGKHVLVSLLILFLSGILFTGCTDMQVLTTASHSQWNEHMHAGDEAVKKRDWDVATLQFTEALAYTGDSGELAEQKTITLSRLADVQIEQDSPEEALPVLVKLLELQHRVLHTGDPRISRTLNSLGMIYYESGDVARGQEHYELSLENLKAASNPDPLVTSAARYNLGIISLGEGDYEKAQHHLLEALNQSQRVRHREDPKLIPVLTQLGLACFAVGKVDAAQGYLERALHIQETRPLPSDVAGQTVYRNTLQNLADFYAFTNQVEKAEAVGLKLDQLAEKTGS